MSARIVVLHGGYCESGCCGHWIEMEDDSGNWKTEFSWDHPDIPYPSNVPRNRTREVVGEQMRSFVRQLVVEAFGEEHCADIDWDGCYVAID